MNALPGTFAELLADFTPGQVARMERFADQATERSPEHQRRLERVFAGAGERLASAQSHRTAA
ncbi:MAG: hypothetical protein JWO67_2049 [Streptosporangiaceae bacterium]|nr:hypothetical protein [Streptosporangiaceae bacterium]